MKVTSCLTAGWIYSMWANDHFTITRIGRPNVDCGSAMWRNTEILHMLNDPTGKRNGNYGVEKDFLNEAYFRFCGGHLSSGEAFVGVSLSNTTLSPLFKYENQLH